MRKQLNIQLVSSEDTVSLLWGLFWGEDSRERMTDYSCTGGLLRFQLPCSQLIHRVCTKRLPGARPPFGTMDPSGLPFRVCNRILRWRLTVLMQGFNISPHLFNSCCSSPLGCPPGLASLRHLWVSWLLVGKPCSVTPVTLVAVAVQCLRHVWLLQPCEMQLSRLFCPWDFSGRNTQAGVGCLLHQYFHAPS